MFYGLCFIVQGAGGNLAPAEERPPEPFKQADAPNQHQVEPAHADRAVGFMLEG